MPLRIGCATLASVTVSILGGPAMAAGQNPAGGAGSGAEPGATANILQEVVVTARRREEPIQNVPIAITALSGEKLEQEVIVQVTDLRTMAPDVNLSGQRRNDAQFFIRGQGPGPQGLGTPNNPSVTAYFAEVPAALPGSGVFFDLANVQILRGPQGTLFGRNTTGGAVLIEPARPGDTFSGYVKQKFGNYNYRETEAMVNIPVGEKAALRVAAQLSRRDGFTRSIATGQRLDGRDYDAVRGSLLLRPTKNFENLTIADYRSENDSGQSEILYAVYPEAQLSSVTTPAALAPLIGLPAGTSATIPIRIGGVVSTGCLRAALPGCPTGPFGNTVAAFRVAVNGGNTSNPANSGFYLVAPTSEILATLAAQEMLGPRVSQTPLWQQFKRMDLGITNKTKFEFNPNLTLENIVALRIAKSNESLDYDGTALNILQQTFTPFQPWQIGNRQFSEEFQLRGKYPGLKLQYVAGVYYEHTKSDPNPQVLQAISVGVPAARFLSNEGKSEAIFAHLEWQPSDVLSLSGGVRRTHDTRAAALSVFNPATFPSVLTCIQTDFATGLITCPIAYRTSFDATTYDVTVDVKPMHGVLVYGDVRHGYKAGGFNLPAPTLALQTFGPEYVDSFETGIKADWGVGFPLRTNLAAFYDRYKDIQVATAVPVPPPINVAAVTLNAGRQTNTGFEAEVTAEPVRPLNLSGFFSYLSATSGVDLVKGPTAEFPNGVPVLIKGRQASGSPRWRVGVSGAYTLPLADNYGRLSVSADYSWQSKVGGPDPSVTPNTFPAYGLLNAHVDWTNILESRVTASVFGRNLADKAYVLGGYQLTPIGAQSVVYGEPRTYGVSLRADF